MSFEVMGKRYNSDSTAGAFDVGDLVWLYNPRKQKGRSLKLTRQWEGPYIILKSLNDLVYRIQRSRQAKPKVVHRNGGVGGVVMNIGT